MRDRYFAASDFRTYLDGVERNRELWHGVYERAGIQPETLEEARRIPGVWHLLVLSEDWCGDAVNLVPVLARLAEETAGLDLRVLPRDENLDLMDTHLTDGKSRSIPVVILFDENFVERGWWGPRPKPIQEWVIDEGLAMPSDERYKQVRRYYAEDKGRTMLREFLDLLGAAA